MSDRVTGLIVIVVALAFFVSATQLEMPFFSDPVGPKTFPILIAMTAMLAGIWLVWRPDPDPTWPNIRAAGRLVVATAVLIMYSLALTPLGFLLPTAIAAAAISWQLSRQSRQSLMPSAFTGIGLSVGLFVIFKYGLGLSLFATPRWLFS